LRTFLKWPLVLCAVTLFLSLVTAQRRDTHFHHAGPHSAVASVRILFGLTDTEPSHWDGTVSVGGGTVKAIQGVRFGPEDSTDYSGSWTAVTRLQGRDDVIENGVLITALTEPDSRWSVHTPRGDFSYTLADLKWGDHVTFLDGAVEVDRVPATAQLTTSDDDEDFPAIARGSGESREEVWIAYARFSHGDRSQESFQPLRAPLETFDFLARPSGGDQVFAARWSRRTNTWSAPLPVSPGRENVSRTAIAIDGQNRVWVFWSAMRNGSFHLFARAGQLRNANGTVDWGPELRISSAAGPNLSPVAATDSKGRVWIAWQGYRNHNLEILASVQNGISFSPEAIVSASPANDWDPALAASPNGDVAVSWGTYAKGDYDIWFSRMRAAPGGGIELDSVIAAASTPLFEAHGSIAFDAKNRLWLAYEVSSARWGKNYGAHDTSGSPLYDDRNIRVRCFDGVTALATSSDLLNALPGTPIGSPKAPPPARRRDPAPPNPNAARNRRPGRHVAPRTGPLNSFPRLAIDTAGGVYLAFRTLSRPAGMRSPVGSVWVENVVYFDGHKWIGPIFVPRSDGLLEGLPALLAVEPGRLLAVSAMDHRMSIPQALGPAGAERINSDLYAADLRLDGLAAPAANPELAPVSPEPAFSPDPRVKAENEQLALIRRYRIPYRATQLRILRGDFHRYTEYSAAGTRDGSLDDAYRYMIDAAALDWGGCCDNENGDGHEYFWWRQQTAADAWQLGDRFIPLFAFGHEARYPEGHRVVLFAKRGIRPMPHLPPVAMDSPPAPAPDTQMLYRYLKAFGGISIPNATATDLGTDWRDHDAAAEPAVEIYQGSRQSYEKEGGPRAAKAGDAIGNLRPLGYVSQALDKGYRLGFTASSDRFSTHQSYTSVLAAEPTREAILDALKKRHVYGSTDNIVADVRSGPYIMGDDFTASGQPAINVKLKGTAPFARVVIVKDGKEVSVSAPNSAEVAFTWSDATTEPGRTSYYYVRGEQSDGQLVWTSPMWITVK
jgi:hypothetical protein